MREKVRERDDHHCQRCGISKDDLGAEPDAHHIIPVHRFNDEENAHTMANLILLCRMCHIAVERLDSIEYGKEMAKLGAFEA